MTRVMGVVTFCGHRKFSRTKWPLPSLFSTLKSRNNLRLGWGLNPQFPPPPWESAVESINTVFAMLFIFTSPCHESWIYVSSFSRFNPNRYKIQCSCLTPHPGVSWQFWSEGVGGLQNCKFNTTDPKIRNHKNAHQNYWTQKILVTFLWRHSKTQTHIYIPHIPHFWC